MAATSRVSRRQPGIAWIIGGGSGIGAALARELAGRGWTVAISGRRQERLDQVAAMHGNIHPYPLDVSESAAVSQTIARITETLGDIDLLIYGAVYESGTPVGTYSISAFEAAFDTNVLGFVRTVDALIPRMRRRGGGQIAVIGSLAGYAGLPRGGAYAATKSALITLTQTMRTELEPDGILVRLVSPGFVKSELTDRNRYWMPMLLETDDAAWRIAEGLLGSERFEIAFPWPMVWLVKSTRLLPHWLYFFLARFLQPKK